MPSIRAYLEGQTELNTLFEQQMGLFDEFGGVPITFEGLTLIADYVKTNMNGGNLVDWFQSPDDEPYRDYLQNNLPSKVTCYRGVEIDPDLYDLKHQEFPEDDLKQIIIDEQSHNELTSCTGDVSIAERQFANPDQGGIWGVVMTLNVPADRIVYSYSILNEDVFEEAGIRSGSVIDMIETEKEIMVLWDDSVEITDVRISGGAVF